MASSATLTRRRRRNVVVVAAVMVLLGGGAIAAIVSRSSDRGTTETPSDELAVFAEHARPVHCLGASPDGSLIASAGDDAEIRLWDPQSRQPRGMLAVRGRINAVAISPDSRQVASGGDDGVVRVWNATTGTEEFSLSGHQGAVTGVAYYPAQSHLLSCGDDGQLILWDLLNKSASQKRELLRGKILCLAISADGRRAITGESTGMLHVWDVATFRELARLEGHSGPVRSAAISPVEMRAASCSDDGTVRWWDLESQQPIATWTPMSAPARPTAVAVSPGGTRILCGSSDRLARLISCEDGGVMRTFTGHSDALTCDVFFPNGAVAATGSFDHTVRLWNLGAPSQVERKRIEQSVEEVRNRIEQRQRFARQMQLGRQSATDGNPRRAADEFTAASKIADPGSLDQVTALAATVAATAGDRARESYLADCEAGKAAAAREDYAEAMRCFQRAMAVFPNRNEALEGYQQAAHAQQLKGALEGLKATSTLTFSSLLPKTGALRLGRDFVCLLPATGSAASRTSVGQQPSWALITTPLVCDIALETPVAVPDDRIVLHFQLVHHERSAGAVKKDAKDEAARDKIVAELKHPLAAGSKQQRFHEQVPSPAGGWPKGDYSVRSELIVNDRVVNERPAERFAMGVIHWRETDVELTASEVQDAGYAVDSGVTVERGDALLVTATGTVAPGPVAFYRELLAEPSLGAPRPAKPEGIKWWQDRPALHRYGLVDVKSNYAALLMRVGIVGWVAYNDPLPPHTMPLAGKLELSINSILQSRPPGGVLRTVPRDDRTYWQPDSGSFKVTILHGTFDFPEKLSLEMCEFLLRRFEF